MRANAAVFEKLFTPLSVTEVEIDAPRPGEALVRIVASGVCHTDALARDGDMPFPAPGVLGHEGAGVVAAVGDGVTGVSVGDKVVIGWPWCGSCRNCLEGQPRYCLELGPLVIAGSRGDGSTSLRRLDGSPLHSHFFGQSSFATHSICAASALVRVPGDADVAILGPLACGLSTGAGAVLNVLRPFAGSAVVVYGAGAVGLSAIMAARLTAATHVIAVDRLASRLSLATELGATEVIDVSAGADPVAAVHEICGGPADFAMDCAGNVSVLRQAADSVGMRGTVALIGGAPAGASFSLDHMSTLWGKRVIGILGGEGRSASLINTLITLNAQGRFPYDRLIEKFPLDRVNEALEASHRGDVVKPVLTMADLHSIAAVTSCYRSSEPSSVREVPVTEPAAYQRSAAEADGFHHHHCGLGDRDPSALQVPAELRDQAIAAELHRLENAQADLLLDHCGAVQPGDRLLDAGSGRGGTSLMANRRFGCAVDGVSISAAHVQFANDQAAARGVADQVRFHYRNMLDTGFATGSRQVIWTNETTMYVGLQELYREFARLLRRGGRYVCVTGCADDVSGGRSTAAGRIARHYTCDIHPRAEYLKALAANGFVPVTVADLTRDTAPYWRLRSASDLATGIEDAFLTAYREGSFQYMLIVADYVGW